MVRRMIGYVAWLILLTPWLLSTPVEAGPAEDDFASRCSAAGVVKCIGFDNTTADIVQGVNLHSGNFGYRGGLDTSVKKSGAGALRFELRAGEASPNLSGSWSPTSNDGLGRNFGEGSTFYIQYALRLSPEMLSNVANYWDSRFKTSLFHYNQQTCGGLELTMIPHYDTRFFIMYKDCGAEAMYTALDGSSVRQDPPILLQQGEHPCQYGQVASPPCWFYPANTWITMYFKVHLGHFRQPDSTIEAWYAVNGGPYHKWINVMSGFTINCNQDSPVACASGSGFNNLTLTPYMTSLSKAAPVTAFIWFDELIVSTQPIRAPGGAAAPGDSTPPAPPTNLRLSSVVSPF